MNVSLYQAAAALDANIQWQQMIAENVASGSVPAFKKSEISFHSVEVGLLGSGSEKIAAQRHASILPAPTISTNFERGALQGTGSPSSLALDGPGYFAVQLPDGSRYYTRDGEFMVTPDGEIMNKDGYELVSESGQPIVVNPRNKENISVSQQGIVSEGLQIKGQLSLFEFADQSVLNRIGAGYFLPPQDVQPVEAVETTIAQGQLEASNTSSATEMSTLMLALRHYEANQRVIQITDERMNKTIQELSATT
ncbi:MAG: flagellar hook-basal body protein [Verrucomicrobia bacterium]|nr:flagellar hook-basal body protein [Verrucomicrobiota bacterium]